MTPETARIFLTGIILRLKPLDTFQKNKNFFKKLLTDLTNRYII